MFLPCTGVVTERTQTQTEESRASSGILGAVVALAPGCLLLAALALVQPFGPTAGVFERSDILLAGLAIVSALGWRLGGGTAGAGWLGAIGGGVTFGLVLPPIGLMVALISAATDAVIRGAANPMTALGPTFAWVLYGIVVVCFYGCMFAIPAGIVWAVVTRALARHLSGFGFGRSRRPTVRLLVALMAIALTAGTSQAIAYSPRNTRCLVLPGGAPTDAAFSPAGDLLAVTMRSDPNAPGTVLLLRWPSTTVVASWTSWVDQEVAVDPAGRVYWSAWTLGDSVDEGPDGVFSAASGSDPALFATGDESELNDLTWTTTGLWGTTPNSHRVARIPLTGGTDMDVEGSKDEVGALWMSPDGSSRIAGPGTFGMRLEVATNIGTSSIAVSGDPRSVALSSDGADDRRGWLVRRNPTHRCRIRQHAPDPARFPALRRPVSERRSGLGERGAGRSESCVHVDPRPPQLTCRRADTGAGAAAGRASRRRASRRFSDLSRRRESRRLPLGRRRPVRSRGRDRASR
jgi:hypothetical protein